MVTLHCLVALTSHPHERLHKVQEELQERNYKIDDKREELHEKAENRIEKCQYGIHPKIISQKSHFPVYIPPGPRPRRLLWDLTTFLDVALTNYSKFAILAKVDI